MDLAILLLHLMLMLACALFFYYAAAMEDKPALGWALLSIVVYILTPTFGLSIIAKLLGQIVLFFAIGIVRAIRANAISPTSDQPPRRRGRRYGESPR